MLILGQKEMEENKVSVRYRDGRQETKELQDFINYLETKVTTRSVEI